MSSNINAGRNPDGINTVINTDRINEERSFKSRAFSEKKSSLNCPKKIGIAAAAIIVASAAVLLAYMHFSGMGISKAGFAQLGQQIGSAAKLAGKMIGSIAANAWNTTTGKVAIVSTGTFILGVPAGFGGLIGKQKYSEAKREKAEQARQAAEEARLAEEAEQARQAEEARLAEEAEQARQAEEARLAEEAEQARQAEETRLAEEAKRAEQAEKKIDRNSNLYKRLQFQKNLQKDL